MATTAKTKTRSRAAPKPPSCKIEDKAQYERFRQFSREVSADQTPQEFDRVFRKVVNTKSS